jgi:glucose/arabinose dehydrogenase
VVDPEARALVLDPASARELLRIDKPQFNHNGGTPVFGPDGMLYVAVGDGGAANDVGVGHAPGGNGQSLAPGNVLGKILRIDPLGRDSGNGRYGIPEENPVLGAGVDEVWAWGFRNPFRMSFDRRTGRLWVGEVGQNDLEEVDVVRPGRNYGWPIKEGTFLFDSHGFVTADSPGAPAGLVRPRESRGGSEGGQRRGRRLRLPGQGPARSPRPVRLRRLLEGLRRTAGGAVLRLTRAR